MVYTGFYIGFLIIPPHPLSSFAAVDPLKSLYLLLVLGCRKVNLLT